MLRPFSSDWILGSFSSNLIFLRVGSIHSLASSCTKGQNSSHSCTWLLRFLLFCRSINRDRFVGRFSKRLLFFGTLYYPNHLKFLVGYMVHHLELDGACFKQHVHLHSQVNVWLVIMALKFTKNLKWCYFLLLLLFLLFLLFLLLLLLLLFLLLYLESIRLFLKCHLWESDLLRSQTWDFERFKNPIACSIGINTCNFQFLIVVGIKRNFESVSASKVWNRHL